MDLRLVLAADCPKTVANKLADFGRVIYADMLPKRGQRDRRFAFAVVQTGVPAKWHARANE